MKKLFPIAIIAVFAVMTFTTSCKKTNSSGQYTCTCTYKVTGATADSTTKIVFPTGYTQSQSSSACSSEQTSLATLWPGATCSL